MRKLPLAIIVFNRPDVVRRLLSHLADLYPTTLFVIANDPRPHNADEAELFDAERDKVSRVSWPCELITDYASENPGVSPPGCQRTELVVLAGEGGSHS